MYWKIYDVPTESYSNRNNSPSLPNIINDVRKDHKHEDTKGHEGNMSKLSKKHALKKCLSKISSWCRRERSWLSKQEIRVRHYQQAGWKQKKLDKEHGLQQRQTIYKRMISRYQPLENIVSVNHYLKAPKSYQYIKSLRSLRRVKIVNVWYG